MFHLDDGSLRRLIDEPQSTLSSAQAHYATCDLCKQRAAQLNATADAVAHAYARADDAATSQTRTQLDVGQALASTRARIRNASFSEVTSAHPHRARLTTALVALASAAAVVLLFLFTPLGTFAQGFLTIFEPRQFQPVAITSTDGMNMRLAPDLTAYGTVRVLARSQSVFVAGPAQAAAVAHMPLRIPAALPANIPGPISWRVSSGQSVMFTFSAAKAAASAAAHHQILPPMPRSLDGATLQVAVGPVVAMIAGERAASVRNGRSRTEESPDLLIAQAPLPRVLSTGASVREIESYLLRQPGIPPRLAAQILSISDPTSVLPIPVPIDKASAQQVWVQGVRGLAVGDNTGVGAAVIWQRDGYIYGVAGSFPESEVLAIANSLR